MASSHTAVFMLLVALLLSSAVAARSSPKSSPFPSPAISPSANSPVASPPVPVNSAPSPSPTASSGSPAAAPAVVPSSISTPPSQAPSSPTISPPAAAPAVIPSSISTPPSQAPSPAISPSANSTASAPVPVKSSSSPSPSAINSPPSPPHASQAAAPAITPSTISTLPSKAPSASTNAAAALNRFTVAGSAAVVVFATEMEIIIRAANSINEFQAASKSQLEITVPAASSCQPRNHECTHRWTKPEDDMVKANSDANLQTLGWWGLGSIVRDDNGLVLASATWKTLGMEDATLAEAFGLLTTVRFAIDCGFRRVVFEGDNEKIIQRVQNDFSDVIDLI